MAKTKALISFAVTMKLICVFVFAYAKKTVFSRRGSDDVLNFMTTYMFAACMLKFKQLWSFNKLICPKGVDGMANTGSVDPDQTAVFSGSALSVL